ncbi:MAG TPA: TetR/AcrR family transcriptional regulator [Rheinheimera sp.]|nr:TetR/AcrR family transcriptional regulator [Rheinheimera sp.]
MDSKTKRHPNPERAEARRQQVLTAAADCFRRKGYHSASMAEISKTAGMSPGHIYNYFVSKDAIIEAIIEQQMVEMFEVFASLQARPGMLIDVMVDGASEGVCNKLDPALASLKLEMLAETARNEKIAGMLRCVDAQARQRFMAILQSERSLVKGEPESQLQARISVIFAMFDGLLIRQTLQPDLTSDAVMVALGPALRALLSPF